MKKNLTLITVLLFALSFNVSAQFKNLYNFDSAGGPDGSLIVVGNKLFGAAHQGGANGFGYIFSVNRDGSGFKDLWDCNDTGNYPGNSNFIYPIENLTFINNRLYGASENGGYNDDGLIFSIDTDGSGYKDMFDFNSPTGAYPEQGALTIIGNKFFGATYRGGVNDAGVIFSIDTDGNNYKDVFDFNESDSIGSYPYDMQLVYSGNKLFGMTMEGGVYDSGTVYSIDTNGSNYKILLNLNNVSGGDPYGHLLLNKGRLYGLTSYGGTNGLGTVFSVDTLGNGLKVLKNLDSITGYGPFGSLTMANNKLYGMTNAGGTNTEELFFAIDTNGIDFKNLDVFSQTNIYNPLGNNLALSGDTLFGMTPGGGASGFGNIFQYICPGGIPTGTGLTSQEPEEGNSSLLYPNPNKGNFTLQVNGVHEAKTLIIYNLLGQAVYTCTLTAEQTNISMANQPAGIYNYVVTEQNNSNVSTGKFIVQ